MTHTMNVIDKLSQIEPLNPRHAPIETLVWRGLLEVNPEVHGGVPCVAGTRITLSFLIVETMVFGASVPTICEVTGLDPDKVAEILAVFVQYCSMSRTANPVFSKLTRKQRREQKEQWAKERGASSHDEEEQEET